MKRTQQETVTIVQIKTDTLKSELLKDRELRRVEQLKTNAEIRRRWLQAEQSQTARQTNV